MLPQITQALMEYVPQPLVYDANLTQAAVLVALTDDEDNPELILTLRSKHLSRHSGEVAFPGGKKDHDDESLLITALRESQEEIDLAPSVVNVIGQLNQTVSKHGIVVTPVVGIVPSNVELKPNPGELDAIFRVPLIYLLEAQPLRWDRLMMSGKHTDVPCFLYQHYQIWGLTAFMLMDLLNLVFGYRPHRVS